MELGESNDQWVEVVGGLGEGDRVLLLSPGRERGAAGARQDADISTCARAAVPFNLAELREFLHIATEALGRYKLRTSLSVLGVVLGVAAVIAMMSVSEGAAREALAQVEALGLDNLVARSQVLGRDRPADAASQAGDAEQLAVARAAGQRHVAARSIDSCASATPRRSR